MESLNLDEHCWVRDLDEEEPRPYAAQDLKEKIEREGWTGSWKLEVNGLTVFVREQKQGEHNQSSKNTLRAAKVGPEWN